MPALRKPRALGRGAAVAIAAPAGPMDAARLEAGEAKLRELGLVPLRRDDLLARRGYLAGEDERRAAELMGWIEDPHVDGVLCARGGYGAARIVERLDAARVREARKPLVGYSDVTTLLLWQERCAGLVGFHGPMLERPEALAPEAWTELLRALRGEGEPPLLCGKPAGGGSAEGRLTGGSLSLVVASLGTPWEVDTRDAILLLEDVGEKPYRLDRMLQQLRAAGKLGGLRGVGIGALTGCSDPNHPSPTAEEVIQDVLREATEGIPVVTGLPFGHCDENRAWPLGVRARIDGDRGEVRTLEHGVEAA